MQATFKPQAKSNAKRFLTSTCKVDAADVDFYLDQVEGQWGTWVDANGKAVPRALANAAEVVEPVAGQALTVEEAGVEVEVTTPAPVAVNPFSQMLGYIHTPAAPAASTVVVDGRIVTGDEPEEEPEEKAPRATAVRPASMNKGYKIQKERVEQNGVKRRSPGTLCGQVWEIFDAMVAQGTQPAAAHLAGIAASKGMNPQNVRCEFYAWRKFNGISGRAPK